MPAKSKKSRFKFERILIILFLLIYLPSLYNWIYGRNIKTGILTYGIIEECINSDALIIRDEETFISPLTGKFIPSAIEGERVPSKFNISMVLGEQSVDLLDNISNIDSRIINAVREKSKKNNLFSSDLLQLDRDITQIVQKMVADINKNNLSTIKSIKLEINSVMEKKALIAGEEGISDAYIDTLKKERNELAKRLNSATSTVLSSSPGTVSYMVDGLEDILKPGVYENITPDLIRKSGNLEDTRYDSEKLSFAGKPFVKLIKGIDYYLAISANKAESESFNTGDRIPLIRINDINCNLDGNVVYKSETKNNSSIMVIRVFRFMQETSSLRKVNVDLIKKQFEGLKIPLRSLLNYDAGQQKATIVLVKANYATFKEVSVTNNDEEYAIIKPVNKANENQVNLYDTYITDPHNIKEGQLITQ